MTETLITSAVTSSLSFVILQIISSPQNAVIENDRSISTRAEPGHRRITTFETPEREHEFQ